MTVSADQIRDAYRLLGVSSDADLRQARKARLDLVRRYHPDVYAGGKGRADRNLAEINAAFDLLRAHLLNKSALAEAQNKKAAWAARQRAAQAEAERAARQRRAETKRRAEAKRAEAAADTARKQAEQEARAQRRSEAQKRAAKAATSAPIRHRLGRPTLSARQIEHAARAEAGFSFARRVWTRRARGLHVLSL